MLLRKDLRVKERNLKIRNITWVWDPVPCWCVGSIFFLRLADHPNITHFNSRLISHILIPSEMKLLCSNCFQSSTFHGPLMRQCNPNPKDVFQATIFGKRDGALSGTAVISGADKNNLIKNTRGWKQGVVHGVQMLPRNQFYKPETATQLYSWTGWSDDFFKQLGLN